MLKAIKEITDLFKENKIICWIDAGCLLKFYRDNELDDDVDLCLFKGDFDRVLALLYETPEFAIGGYWRNQIVVHCHGIQIDLFFCEVDENSLYFYSYYSDSNSGTKCNVEWRMKYPLEVYLPLKKHTFENGLTLLVPNNIEKKLELMYGDWKTPNPTPTFYWNVPCWDKNYLERDINLKDEYGTDV